MMAKKVGGGGGGGGGGAELNIGKCTQFHLEMPHAFSAIDLLHLKSS